MKFTLNVKIFERLHIWCVKFLYLSYKVHTSVVQNFVFTLYFFIFQKSSNPIFMRTVVFGSAMNDKTDIKMEAYDMRERYTSTKTLLGTSLTSIQEIKQTGRIRLKVSGVLRKML